MPIPGPDGARAAAATIDLFITKLEHRLARWAGEVADQFHALPGRITGTATDKIIRPAVEALLADAELGLSGAGFVANVGLLGPDRSFIAWWQGLHMDRVDALANFSTTAGSRYLKADWFRIPVQTGAPTVTGPYIDLLCTDEFILTFAHPVVGKDGRSIIGIVGMDITIDALERTCGSVLRGAGDDAVLVNEENRVVLTASPGTMPGDVLEAGDCAHAWPVGSRFRVWSRGADLSAPDAPSA